MSYRLSEDEYQNLLRRQGKISALQHAEKPHKYKAKRVVIDGLTFPSKLEGQCYVDLKWQAIAGLITTPLLQVRFALGKHYSRERFYVSDFCFVDLQSGELIVADAKGMRTDIYNQKKKVFEELYGICILEIGGKYGNGRKRKR